MTRHANSGPSVPLSDGNRKTLRDARHATEYTQAELANLLGVSKQHVSDTETGRRDPSIALLNRWCKAIGLTCEVQTVVTLKVDR